MTTKQKLILLGGGGHCISCIDVVQSTGEFEIVGILDQNIEIGTKILDYQVLGNDDLIPELVNQGCGFLITVGQIKSAKVREILYQKVKNAGGFLPVIIAKNALVSKYAKIDEGSIVMNNAFVNSMSKIGKCAIVNSGALLEHECVVGHFCHISTSATINGQVQVGNHCFIGSKSVVNNNIKISSGIILGAGSVVINDLTESGIYAGVPAVKK